MPAVYEKMGIRFSYPENWTLDEEDALEGEASVSVYSPGGAFWTIVLHPRSTDPRKLALAAMQAVQREYEDFEAEPVSENMVDRELTGFDMNFYCLDLTNTALVRAFRNSVATCVVLCQAEDREFAAVAPVFRAITTSLLQND